MNIVTDVTSSVFSTPSSAFVMIIIVIVIVIVTVTVIVIMIMIIIYIFALPCRFPWNHINEESEYSVLV